MNDPLTMLPPNQLLTVLLTHDIESLRIARELNPDWIPGLPPKEGVNLRRRDLSGMELHGIDFSGIDISGANLSNARLDDTNLAGADLTGAKLNGATLSGANLIGTKGLFGTTRARFSSHEDEAEAGIASAMFRKRGDHLPWSVLRSITTLRIFGASYILMIVLVAYAGLVEWINTIAFDWASLIPKDDYLHSVRQLLVSKIPLIDVEPHFGIQLLMVLCLALGATIYEFSCPDLIKENTESRWTRELNQSLIEYRAADASRPRARTVAFCFYGIGSLYTLAYGAVKVAHATLYFFGLLGGIYLQ